MHHNPRAFDVSDPDATQAIEDALPIVEELLAEQAKPEPRGAEPKAAWLAYQAEIRSRLNGLADRAGMTVTDLESLAVERIRAARSGRLPRQAPPFTSPTAPDMGFKELADELGRLRARDAELAAVDAEILALGRRVAAKRNRLRVAAKKIEQRLRRRGRVLA